MMQQSPTKSPQKKILRVSSDHLGTGFAPEIQILEGQERQVGILK
jgi:hypothetical protein